jgi:hypothetical protein
MAAIDQLELLAGRKAADRPSAAAPTAAADADEDDLAISSDINTVLLGGRPFCACDARRLLCGRRDRAADSASLCAEPRADAGDEGAPAGASTAGACGHARHPGLFATLGGLGAMLSAPATSWAEKLPTGIPKLQERLSFLSRPIAAFQKFADQAQGLTLGGEAKAIGQRRHLFKAARRNPAAVQG